MPLSRPYLCPTARAVPAFGNPWLLRRASHTRNKLPEAVRWVFLLAYACSGLAGLIYEVSWTRLLTLYIGHTTAAAQLFAEALWLAPESQTARRGLSQSQ